MADKKDSTDNAHGEDDVSDDVCSIPHDELKGIDDEEGLVDTIIEVSKAGDLSPRKTNTMKEKKGRSNVPLQVQIRSSKGRFVICDQ